jgi:malate dehydrogenase (quinone)
VVTSQDGSIAALLGASPGASTAVAIMLEVLARCFASRYQSQEWQAQLSALMPSLGRSLRADGNLERLCVSG